MRKKTQLIPVNTMTDNFAGISIKKLAVKDLQFAGKITLDAFNEKGKRLHRHDSHSFFLLESGTVRIEIDFQNYVIIAPSVIYIHPDQVHRTIVSEDVIVNTCAITNENLNTEYRKLLEDIVPAKPVMLTNEIFFILSHAISTAIKLAERKNDKLYCSFLRDSCNTFVALVISQYLELAKPAEKNLRFETVAKKFRKILEHDYIIAKRPAYYAEKLNISASYLNECVKYTTGNPVSYHIQQRVILEAKRLLYDSTQSVKEIAALLGYDDYPYFSRLFTKVTGITALAFRNKNHG